MARRDTKVELAAQEPLPMPVPGLVELPARRPCSVHTVGAPAWHGEARDEAEAIACMRAAFGIRDTVYPFRVEWC